MLPRRHSLFWRLAAALVLFCLLLIGLHMHLSGWFIRLTSHLPAAAITELQGMAATLEQAWERDGRQGLRQALEQLSQQESIWAVVVDDAQQPLSGQPLSEAEQHRLNFQRPLEASLGRPDGNPTFFVPFARHPYRLALELPQRLNPRRHLPRLNELLLLLPVLLSVLLGLLLYRVFITPLEQLRQQADTLGDGNLSSRVAAAATTRRDELGDLARTFNRMAGRLESTIEFQRHLLRDLSHELRTPLSRLRVLNEQNISLGDLQERLRYELDGMEQLIGDTLELIWLDTEKPRLPTDAVDIAHLWDTLSTDARFESGRDSRTLRCTLQPGQCIVRAHLNGLAQALENILRNAIRHTPPDSPITLSGEQQENVWHLWIQDEGPGVAEADLERIFLPFARLNQARPGGDGFGLGLSIARTVVQLQGGDIWAENTRPGLRIHLRLQMYIL